MTTLTNQQIEKILSCEQEGYRSLKHATLMLKKAKYGSIEHHQLLEYLFYKLNQSERNISRAGRLVESKPAKV
jgi:hypothetical protein